MSTGVCAIFPGHGGDGSKDSHLLTEPAAAAAIAEASDAAGWEVLAPERSDIARRSGVRILTTNVAIQRALSARGLRFSVSAGHSLGELCSAVACESITLSAAVDLLLRRAHLLERIDDGTMVAVHGVTLAEARRMLASLDRDVYVAVVNGERSLTVAGRAADLKLFCDAARHERSCRTREVAAAAPFHTPLMEPILDEWTEVLDSVAWAHPSVPIISCVDGRTMTSGEDVAASLRDQLTTRVDWPATIRACCDARTECFVELGIGGMLSGLHRGLRCGVPCVDVTRSRSQRALAELLRDGGGD